MTIPDLSKQWTLNRNKCPWRKPTTGLCKATSAPCGNNGQICGAMFWGGAMAFAFIEEHLKEHHKEDNDG